MVTGHSYQPDRNDFVWIDFSPHAGTEQGGRRPALVLSPRSFNVSTGLIMACPITSKFKQGTFEVVIPGSHPLEGVVLCDHLKSMDWITRKAQFHARATDDFVDEVLARVAAILRLELP